VTAHARLNGTFEQTLRDVALGRGRFVWYRLLERVYPSGGVVELAVSRVNPPTNGRGAALRDSDLGKLNAAVGDPHGRIPAGQS
jgi:hypothetical protein